MSTTSEQVPVTGVGQRIWSENVGCELAVSAASWTVETQREHGADAIVAHQVQADEFTATVDGIGIRSDGWHEGAEADAVYFERFAAGVCVSHGWVDSVSRQIVQVG